ncbi:hypothetical protein PLESTB_001049000 [Pleodorina starrii]|uniref:Uncharacterized protein n=1 Tax=Pleodorina starrii TaxID=330485 RepID=A0A9W6BPW0_9CHLO|nr:hypothetical protein PLESTB_001049000 [Pleodorina starrii]
MEEERPEFAEAIQVGKRRSSLGALSKSKPVTKLKSMFENKGPAPIKMKDSGLLGKLKPISASHDGSSFAAAVSSSLGALASQKFSAPHPSDQLPATPPEPLFSVLPPPAVEQDVLPNPSPPRSIEHIRTSMPGFSESMLDSSEADARLAKSPGSAGFLKRMGSSIKKALTPKSSAGKHKHGGSSPSYAGSDASNLSPRPSGQLMMTPTSQPSSTSLDLNCRSDQLQSAPLRSPSALMGYEVHNAHEDQDWSRSGDCSLEIAPRPVPSSGRPPRSPNSVTPPSGGVRPSGASPQMEASPHSASRDVAPRMLAATSPDQSQIFQGETSSGAPMAPEDSFVSAVEANGSAAAGSARSPAADGEDSFAASLTASPTLPEGSEASRGSPPMREVNMGAAIFSPPPFPMPSDEGAGDMVADATGSELVFPSLPSSDLPGNVAHSLDAAATAATPLVPQGAGAGVATAVVSDERADVDMAASDMVMPAEEPPSFATAASAPDVDTPPSTGSVAAETDAAESSMEVDGGATQQGASFHPAAPLASRRSFGAALNLDLSEAVAAVGSPGSPDTTTPTGEGNNTTDRCIIGLTPIRPETAAMCAMHVDTPVLSTVAEDSPEPQSSPRAMELRATDLEADFNSQADGAQEMDVELALSDAIAAANEPVPYAQGGVEQPYDIGTAPDASTENRSPRSPEARSPIQEVPPSDVVSAAGPQVAAEADMDWDDSAVAVPCAEVVQQPDLAYGAAGSPLATGMAAAEVLASAGCKQPMYTGIPAQSAAPQIAIEPPSACAAEPLAGAATSPGPGESVSVGQQAAEAGTPLAVADQDTAFQFAIDGPYGAPVATVESVPEHNASPLQLASSPAAPMASEAQAPDSIPAGSDMACVEGPMDSACAQEADGVIHAAPLAEASGPETAPRAQVPDEDHMAVTPEALLVDTAADVGNEDSLFAEAPPAAVEAVAEATPSAHVAAEQQARVSGEVDELSEVSGLPPLELVAIMEEPGACAVTTASDAANGHADASQLPSFQLPDSPAPPALVAEEAPALASSPVASSLEVVKQENNASSGPVAEEAPALEITPIEQSDDAVNVLADASAANDLASGSASPVPLANPYDGGSDEKICVDAPHSVAQGASTMPFALGPEPPVAGQPVSPKEYVPLEPEPSPVEPELPLAFHVAAAEAAAAADVSPAAVPRQPAEVDADLMDVDSSAAQPPACPVAFVECAEAAPVAADHGLATAVQAAASQPTGEQQQSAAPEAVLETVQQSVQVAAAPGRSVHLRYQLTDNSMEQDSFAPGSTTSDMSFLDSAIAARMLTDPAYAAFAGVAETSLGAAAASPTQAMVPDSVSASSAPAPAAPQSDDPMMVSPMPQRLTMLPPALRLALDQPIPQASPDAGAGDAPPSAAPSTGTPGMPTPISPETARLGVRAFQLDDIEEPEASGAEAAATTEVPMQERLPEDADRMRAQKADSLLPSTQSALPAVDGMVLAAATTAPMTVPADTEDAAMAPTSVEGSIPMATPATADARTSAGGVPAMEAPPPFQSTLNADVTASVPSVLAPQPAMPSGIDVPMADSLEEIEALWGNDDLLATPGSDATGSVPLPQIASSPVSASKQSESPILARSGRKAPVAPGVVLQVQRESLDLFSLRNSCAARVSDSLMVESLDSFESMGLCAKSRAVGFVPMAPLKEGDEDAAAVGRTSGSEGGSAPTSAGQPSPDVTFAVDTRGSPDSVPTPGLGAAAAATSTAADTPSANKPAACNAAGACGGLQTPAAAAAHTKAPTSILKSAIPGSATRPNATPSTALKAMAAANSAGPSAAKAGVPKRALPAGAPSAKALLTPGQQVAGSCAAPSGSRLPGFGATPGAGAARMVTATPTAKLPVPSPAAAAPPGAAPGRPGVTPRTGGVFGAAAAATSRAGQFAQQPAPAGRTASGAGLFDTPLVLRAAAVPLADTPLSGCEFDLDTVDISAEASKAIAMLGGGDHASGTVTQHATPVLAPMRGAPVAGTPTLSVLETHVQLLTNKLAEAEANIHQLQDENAMLRDQLSTLQFESSMTNDLDMEREARQFLEQELAVVRHRSDGLESELRTAHAEVKRREHQAAELLAAQQTKEAEWARREAEMEVRMQQMASEMEAARNFAQQADARISEAEARAAEATAKCKEETDCRAELQRTLGMQAHQIAQLQRARDDESAKFQKAMQQLIAAQTNNKKAVVELEQKTQQANMQAQQFNELRDRYRQVKQLAQESEQRLTTAEARVQESTAALTSLQHEKKELMDMCNLLLTQLEAAKTKGGR